MEVGSGVEAHNENEIETLREKVRNLEAALGQRNDKLAYTFKLTPAQTSLLGLLLALPSVNADTITDRLGIVTDVKVAIHRLRNELKTWDIAIQSKRNLGYWLDEGAKGRIKGMLGNDAADQAKKDEVV